MTGIGKIWAKRVQAGTQNACDCPREYRDTMLQCIADNDTRHKLLVDCIESDIGKKSFPTRQTARDYIGVKFSSGEISESEMLDLVDKVDSAYV